MQYKPIGQPPILNQPIINQMPQQHYEPPLEQEIEPERDAIDTYGSIIKDLTDTDKIMEDFELRLRGKKKSISGEIVDDPKARVYIKTDEAARDFVNIVKSIVNRHTDFSYYEEKEAYSIIEGAAVVIPEWLMNQGEIVPKGYRQKIGFEAMSYIKASCHKALNGRMLTWTKGAITEQNQLQPKPEKRSIWDFVMPGKRGAY